MFSLYRNKVNSPILETNADYAASSINNIEQHQQQLILLRQQLEDPDSIESAFDEVDEPPKRYRGEPVRNQTQSGIRQ